MKKIFIYLTFALFALAGCVDNDLPYPVVVPNITSVIVDEAEDIKINYDKRTVTIYLPETEDIRNVAIRSVQIDKEIAKPSIELTGVHDLSKPLRFKIRTYEDYDWTIIGVRPVERYFTVKGQVGATVIDEVNCRVVVNVGKRIPLSAINVTSMKLGPKGKTTYSMPMDKMTNFTDGLSIDVTAFNYTEKWWIFIEHTDATVDIKNINPWTYKAYVTSLGIAGEDNGFLYRKLGDQDWIDVADADITADGGSFVAEIKNLQPETEYEVVATCGSDKSSVKTFVTSAATPIPNGSFEYASKVAGQSYYKFYDPNCGFEDGSYMFWGSGNGEGSEGVNGSASMGIVITYIDTDEYIDGKQSVRAQTSQMAGILAAGNLFTGQFAGLVGTSGGKVNFGRPWTTRPVAMKLYCKYETGKMDIIKGMPPGVSLSSDDYDCAEIKFAIGNWTHKEYGGTPASPVHVNTTDASTFVDFNTDEATIANGSLIINHDGYVLNNGDKIRENTSQWIEYTIPLQYHNQDQIPTHIIISCAASRYGDYFSGCSSSALWIDAVELIY